LQEREYFYTKGNKGPAAYMAGEKAP
jgi:hypothetical protein